MHTCTIHPDSGTGEQCPHCVANAAAWEAKTRRLEGTSMPDLPEILTSAAFQLKPRPAVCPLTPMDDYVICERLDSEDSVLVPDHLKKKSNKGRVVAVGPGRLLQSGAYAPVQLAVGDIVVFGGYLKEDAGITVNDIKWLICQAGDIVAKVNA